MERHDPGAFCWVELATTDEEGAKAFYTNLFGWSAHDDPVGPGMVYSMLQLEERNAGALYGMNEEMRGMGIPPHWLIYVSVASVRDATEKARSLGATVVREPMDVFDIGSMSVFRDPSGATLALWEPKHAHGVQVLNEVNAFSWAELLTRDVEGSKRFYTSLFGWDSRTDPGGYTEWINGGMPIGGMLEIAPEWGPVPPNWMAYFRVDDCDKAVKRVEELGGKVLSPAKTIEGVGRFAVLHDPQGAAFSVIHLTHQPR